MKFLITSSLIIGTVFLLGASTSLNAINTQSLVKNSNVSNIIKVRGGAHMGGGSFGHSGGGFGHHGGDFAHHGGNFSHDGNFGHHGGWNGGEDVGVGVGVGVGGVGIDGGPAYIEGPGYDYDTGTVCVGPDCDVLVE